MRSFVALLVLISLFAAGIARAAVTDNSVLSCETSDVLPNRNITCLIYLRDELQEPTTTSSAASVFSIRVVGDVSEAVSSISTVTVTPDPTVVRFTVSSSMGSRLRIDAYVSDSGLPIRNTGAVALVLESPPANFAEIKCDCGTSLALRATTKCTALATGIHGLPAHAAQSDFFLSEEHGDGSFKFLSGNRALEFTYTAPSFPSMTYGAFLFRLGLRSATVTQGANIVARETTLALSVVYPSATRPTEYSRLRCGSVDTPTLSLQQQQQGAQNVAGNCFVSALDVLGPVAFSEGDFEVKVQRNATVSTPDGPAAEPATPLVVDATEVSWKFLPGGNAGTAALVFSLNRNMLVFSGRVDVRVRTGDAAGRSVRGSPTIIQFGVAPMLTDLRFVKCARGFAVSTGTVLCYVSVANGATPDPAYVIAEADVGTITCKYANNDTATTDKDSDLKGKSLIVLCYTAKAIAATSTERQMDNVVVYARSAAGGERQQIAGSPLGMVVYPKTSKDKEADTRLAAVIAGFLLFLPPLIAGLYFNYSHASHERKILQRLTANQKKAAESSKNRPLFLMPESPVEENEININNVGGGSSFKDDDDGDESGTEMSPPAIALQTPTPQGTPVNAGAASSAPSAKAAK